MNVDSMLAAHLPQTTPRHAPYQTGHTGTVHRTDVQQVHELHKLFPGIAIAVTVSRQMLSAHLVDF